MIFCTSIAPSHKNEGIQKVAVDSWLKLGANVYSFNNEKEIEFLRKEYPKVNFIAVKKTGEHHYGKPYIFVDDIIDFGIEKKSDICIINSDIILSALPKTKSDAIVISHRTDFIGEYPQMRNLKKYIYGIDVFFIPYKFLSIYPKSIYCLGQCWWDYWIPFVALKNKIPVFRIRENFAFHKLHPAQYNHENYKTTIDYFRIENKIMIGNDQKLSDSIWTYIVTNSPEI